MTTVLELKTESIVRNHKSRAEWNSERRRNYRGWV